MTTPARETKRSPITAKVRRAVWEKYGGRCAYCGVPVHLELDKVHRTNRMQVDHIIPVAKGGTNDPANLNPACGKCNWWKADIDLERYRQLIAFRRDGVPIFSKPQREWLKAHVFDIDTFIGQLEPHVFWFEQQEAMDDAA